MINDPRYAPAGVLAPKSKADLAFTMHMLSWLAVSGTAAIVEFPGVLYRGGAEQKIRKYLIDNNYIDTVIQLPPDLFFGTTIATCVIVLKKSKTDNASCSSTPPPSSSTPATRTSSPRRTNRRSWTHSRRAPTTSTSLRWSATSEIAANDYNIAVPSYVEQADTREAVDIITLNAEIARIVGRQSELRAAIDAIVADLEGNAA